MKLWAKGRLKKEEDAEQLLRAFFENFNPASKISISAMEVKLEVVFNDNNPPVEIAGAIGLLKNVEFSYGDNLNKENINFEQTNDATVGEEVPEEPEQAIAGEDVTEEPNQAIEGAEAPQKPEQVSVGKPKRRANSRNKQITIPELEEIAKKATSFKHFVKLVAEWLDMGKKQRHFEVLTIAAAGVNDFSWKELNRVWKENGIFYSSYDTTLLKRKLRERLGKSTPVTTLTFLDAIRMYKEYSFEQETKNPADEASVEMKVKMECMPEISDFEEVLRSVDKTQPIEERIKYVLGAMGLEQLTAKEQEYILKIANMAVRRDKVYFELILTEAAVHESETSIARMRFSKFINDFAQKHGSENQIRVQDFLSDLQKIIMLENEIENNSDSTN